MDSEAFPSPEASRSPEPASPESSAPAKKKRAVRKTAVKKASPRRVVVDKAATAGSEPEGASTASVPPTQSPSKAAKTDSQIAATPVEPPRSPVPRSVPSLKPRVPEHVPMAFSADPDDEPPAPPVEHFVDEVESAPATKFNPARGGGYQDDQGSRGREGPRYGRKGNDSRQDRGPRDNRDNRDSRDNRDNRDNREGSDNREPGGGGNRDHRDRRGPKPKGGGNHPRPERNKPPFSKKDKFQKKERAPHKQAAKAKSADGFFGTTDTFVIEVGELNSLNLLREPEKMAALADAQGGGDGGPVELNRLFTIPLKDLVEVARDEFSIELEVAPVRDLLIDRILIAAYQAKRPIFVSGIVETTADGYGLIVYENDSYRVRPINTFIPKTIIKRFGIKRGTMIKAQIHPKRRPLPADAVMQIRSAGKHLSNEQPIDALTDAVEEEIAEEVLAAMFPPSEFMQEFEAEEETCPYLLKVITLMDKPAEENLQVTPFEDLIPYYPKERIILETEAGVPWDNMAMRVVDLLTPVGLGQRGLIVAPPRTGKTVLQQGIANAVIRNSPKAHLIVLLIDERPEEVTDFRRQITRGEVIASTFDESPENHVHCAEMVIEKARRMVEDGRDVIILLDSITRLARAYNALASNSGKILSGGVEANALQKPKRFFGSARNIEEGGSLTIIGTALVETGSRMDEVIFEEFKGTGNMELHLDRQLSDKRIFPAIEMAKSGTRKEELLYHKDEMLKVYGLRRAMKGVPPIDAMEMLITRIKKTPNNLQFLLGINS